MSGLMIGKAIALPVGSSKPIAWLIKDEFTTARAAGAVDGTAAEPGPGTRTVIDTGPYLSISTGRLRSSDVAGNADPRLTYGAQTRAAGLALFSLISHDRLFYAGFDKNTTGIPDSVSNLYLNNTDLRIYDTSLVQGLATVVVDTDYTLAVILRAAGAFYLIKGGTFSDWTLVWVGSTNSEATLYPCLALRVGGDDVHTADYIRAAQLASPWNSATGVATDATLSGSVSAGSTFTHTADCLIEFEADALPTNNEETIDFHFRIQDASNYWQLTIDDDGDMVLNEVVAGAPTSRGTSAGNVAAGDRIVIVCDDENIDMYEDGNKRITYSSAANFKTATSGELDGLATGSAVKDIIAWPRTMTGVAKDELDRHIT